MGHYQNASAEEQPCWVLTSAPALTLALPGLTEMSPEMVAMMNPDAEPAAPPSSQRFEKNWAPFVYEEMLLVEYSIEPHVLLHVDGEPMIAHVIRAARAAANVQEVLVATDHDGIARVARAEGVDAIMTDSALPSGTDRVAAALLQRCGAPADVVVNVQARS